MVMREAAEQGMHHEPRHTISRYQSIVRGRRRHLVIAHTLISLLSHSDDSPTDNPLRFRTSLQHSTLTCVADINQHLHYVNILYTHYSILYILQIRALMKALTLVCNESQVETVRMHVVPQIQAHHGSMYSGTRRYLYGSMTNVTFVMQLELSGKQG